MSAGDGAPRGRGIRLGLLTPSSNTVLEPVVAQLLTGAPGVSAHFSRLRVKQIALGAAADAQFAAAPMLAAAELLADALVDVIVWGGTAGSWLGLDYDRALCATLASATGIPATTSALALEAAYAAFGVSRIGLVTPYTDDVNAAIGDVYARGGRSCPIALGCGLRVNEQFAHVAPAAVETMIREAAAQREVEAVAVVCTNMNGAAPAAALGRELGKPVLDSVAATVWQALRLTEYSQPQLAQRWGGLFAI